MPAKKPAKKKAHGLTKSKVPARQREKTQKEMSLALRDGTGFSTAEKMKRDAFVSEFLIDWNPTQAALRVGIPATLAKRAGRDFMLEAYVSHQINERLRQLEPLDVISRQQVFYGLLKEATNPSNAGFERIKAWELIGKMKGMFIEKLEIKHEQPGAILLPAWNMETWEAEATRTQAELKEKALLQANKKPVIDV